MLSRIISFTSHGTFVPCAHHLCAIDSFVDCINLPRQEAEDGVGVVSSSPFARTAWFLSPLNENQVPREGPALELTTSSILQYLVRGWRLLNDQLRLRDFASMRRQISAQET
jgi:hypothetical protein